MTAQHTRTHTIDVSSILRDQKTTGEQNEACIKVENLNLFYAEKQALHGVNMEMPKKKVTAYIGPSGCGKSTLLRCINRMNDLVDNVTIEGKILLDNENIYDKAVNVAALRRRVGMVFQKPNPFPKSIFENVTYGLRIQGINDKRILEETVENALRGAALWDEVKDRLNDNALGLSGGQQQRLVIARAIAIEPEVLLLDEPASALDPISTLKIEELINELKEKYTIVIVTHNMQQAARVSDYTAFMYMGELIEMGTTSELFTNPRKNKPKITLPVGTANQEQAMDNSKIGHHISGQFNKELEDVRNKVLTMGGLVEQQIELAVTAFSTGDVEMAELVIKQDNQVDALEMAIDQECMQIFALRQPAAFDLRLLITVIKVINELERVGDLAERIAEMAIQLSGADNNKHDQYFELEHMAELVQEMLHGALDVFARMNVEDVTTITGLDENVDREYASIIRQLITRMMEDPRNITRMLDVLWIARSLERIGDHACNVCEHLVYMVKGEDVRHLTQEELERKMKE